MPFRTCELNMGKSNFYFLRTKRDILFLYFENAHPNGLREVT